MKKRILEYRNRIDKLLEKIERDKLNKSDIKNNEAVNVEDVLKEHLQQIAFFQHERLIHLIVTITFALMTMIALGIFLITTEAMVVALIVLLLVLLVPYIMHYYLLENEVQKMYEQYDELLKYVDRRK